MGCLSNLVIEFKNNIKDSMNLLNFNSKKLQNTKFDILCDNSFDIDFVVLWVDSNDYDWQREKAKYSPRKSEDVHLVRYQNWDNIKYWFRAVSKYAPWVRQIHFVTCGQVPIWLNIEHPKINLVRHSDYMPVDALPTFNSSAIEIGINYIPNLAEHFVFFNDDMFLTAPISPEYFFKSGMPYDMPGFLCSPKKVDGNVFSALLLNNSNILQKYFSKEQLLKNRIHEWLNPKMGKTFLRTLYHFFSMDFPGFVIPHLSTPYLKSDFDKVWSVEAQILRETQHHRFRNEADVTHFLIRNWRMCEGCYIPRKSKGKYFSVDGENSARTIAAAIKNQKYPEICINEICTGVLFERIKNIVNEAFELTLCEACEFEK